MKCGQLGPLPEKPGNVTEREFHTAARLDVTDAFLWYDS